MNDNDQSKDVYNSTALLLHDEQKINNGNSSVAVVVEYGTVLFTAKLSPSFALFTLERSNGNGPPLDVVITNKRQTTTTTTSATADDFIKIDVSAILNEVEQCQRNNTPLSVVGRQNPSSPYEKCNCSENCSHFIMHCITVNDLPIPIPQKQQKPKMNNNDDDDNNDPKKKSEQQQHEQKKKKQNNNKEKKNDHQQDDNIMNFFCKKVGLSTSTPPPPIIQLQLEKKQQQQQQRQRRPTVKNRGRSSRFVELLLDVFGEERLSVASSSSVVDSFSSSDKNNNNEQVVGVLDVAGGGTGGLYFELSVRRGIPCTTIDPRPVKLRKDHKNTMKFRQNGIKVLQPGQNISHYANVLLKRYKKRNQLPKQILKEFDHQWAQTPEGNQLLQQCTIIVGMHPDQATHSIVELAKQYNKPWAIVPCCVFPNHFRKYLPPPPPSVPPEEDHHHKDGNSSSSSNNNNIGKKVRTYDDLCEYLRTWDLDGNNNNKVKEKILDFEGRNKAYYWVPQQ